MSSDEHDKSTEQVLEYYKKYSQNRNLTKYFSGTSVSYLPPIVVEKDEELVSVVIKGIDKSTDSSSSESASDHKKLEWDNGADIGYKSARNNSEKSLLKSSSLPVLDASVVPNIVPSTVITHSTSEQDVKILVYPSTSSSNQESAKASPRLASSTTSNGKSPVIASDSTTTNTDGATPQTSSKSEDSRFEDFQKTINFLKHKIGLPEAQSTPNVVATVNSENLRPSLGEFLSQDFTRAQKKDKTSSNVSSKASASIKVEVDNQKKSEERAQLSSQSSSKSASSSTSPSKKPEKKVETKIVQLSISTPINVNCKGFNLPCSNKNIQTYNDATPKAVQTDTISLQHIQTQFDSKVKTRTLSISEDSAASSFEYIKAVSGVIKEVSIAKSDLETSEEIDRHMDILEKLLKAKKINSRTKRKFIRRLIKHLGELDVTNNDSSSSDLFVPKSKKGKLKFAFEQKDKSTELSHSSEEKKSEETNRETISDLEGKNYSQNDRYLNESSLKESLTTDSDKCKCSSNDSESSTEYNVCSTKESKNTEVESTSFQTQLKDNAKVKIGSLLDYKNSAKEKDVSLSSAHKIEIHSKSVITSDNPDDYLLKFAENERTYQLNWINNEISHLSKLKNILESKMPKPSSSTNVYNVLEKTGSTRSYVIQTQVHELPKEGASINYHLNGKEYVVSDSQKSSSDADKAIIADIEVESTESQTNIKVNTICSACRQAVCVCSSGKTVQSKFSSLSTEFEDDQAQFTSLQKVFRKCCCTMDKPNCGCNFVKKLLDRFQKQIDTAKENIDQRYSERISNVWDVQTFVPEQDKFYGGKSIQKQELDDHYQSKSSKYGSTNKTKISQFVAKKSAKANQVDVESGSSSAATIQKHVETSGASSSRQTSPLNELETADFRRRINIQTSQAREPQTFVPEQDKFYKENMKEKPKLEFSDRYELKLSSDSENGSNKSENGCTKACSTSKTKVSHSTQFVAETSAKANQVDGESSRSLSAETRQKHIETSTVPFTRHKTRQTSPLSEADFRRHLCTQTSKAKELQTFVPEQDAFYEEYISAKPIEMQELNDNYQSKLSSASDNGPNTNGSSKASSTNKAKISHSTQIVIKKSTKANQVDIESSRLSSAEKYVETSPLNELKTADFKRHISTQTEPIFQNNFSSIDQPRMAETDVQTLTGDSQTKREQIRVPRISANTQTLKIPTTESTFQAATQSRSLYTDATVPQTDHKNQVKTSQADINVQTFKQPSSDGAVQSIPDNHKQTSVAQTNVDNQSFKKTAAAQIHLQATQPSTTTQTTTIESKAEKSTQYEKASFPDSTMSTSESKSSGSSRVICYCCKEKAFLAEVSYLEEGNDSLVVCSRCYYKKPRVRCRCKTYSTNSKQVCKCCKMEVKRHIGMHYYTVTLKDDGSLRTNTFQDNLENIQVYRGWSPKSEKDKENDNRKNGLKKHEVEATKEQKRGKKLRIEQKKPLGDVQYTLTDYLMKNKPEFVYSAEYRRQMLLNSRIFREQQKDALKLNFLENNIHYTTNGGKFKLFSEREMKAINKKNYQKLPEVQQKLVNQRDNRLRHADRLITNMFAKKIQKSVLQGRGNFPIDKTLTKF